MKICVALFYKLVDKIEFSCSYRRYTKCEVRKFKKFNLFTFFKNSKKALTKYCRIISMRKIAIDQIVNL